MKLIENLISIKPVVGKLAHWKLNTSVKAEGERANNCWILIRKQVKAEANGEVLEVFPLFMYPFLHSQEVHAVRALMSDHIITYLLLIFIKE